MKNKAEKPGAAPRRTASSPPERPLEPIRTVERARRILRYLDEGEESASAPSPPANDFASVEARASAWSSDRSFDALQQLACSMAAEMNFQELIKRILHSAVQTLGAERGILFLGHGLDSPLVPVLAVDIEGEELEHLERVSRTILQEARTAGLFFTPDAASDPRLDDAASVRLKEIRSVMCIRLAVEEEFQGVLYLDSPGAAHAFVSGAERFLRAFADIAAVALRNARLHSELRIAHQNLTLRLQVQERFWDLPTRSRAWDTLKANIALAAQIETPVLLIGEPGTGAEQIARAIHASGPRSLRPFLTCDCALAPRAQLEVQLFGHARGGSGGPLAGRPGLLRAADRGILFLNEITALNPRAQEKLLDCLQEGRVRPVRSREAVHFDTQIISATSRDARTEMGAGRLNRELFYLLNTMEIAIPPLRERPEDLPVLADHLLRKHAALTGAKARPGLTAEAVDLLQRHSWPGNVDQLEWLIERAVARVEGRAVDGKVVRDLLAAWDAWVEGGSSRLSDSAEPASDRPSSMRAIRTMAEIERDAIVETLIRTHGNRSKTARLLGIQRNTLLRRIEKLGVRLEGIPNPKAPK